MEKPKYERIWDLVTGIYSKMPGRRKFFEQKLPPKNFARGKIAETFDLTRKIPTTR